MDDTAWAKEERLDELVVFFRAVWRSVVLVQGVWSLMTVGR